ncbi:MAG: hypothetical protein GXO62_05195 [Epsilonproteobacteria bacterium]|nr:hypothetical protein [Campylobacterota bacterium]
MEDKIALFLEEGDLHKKRILAALGKLPKIDKNILENDEYLALLDSLAFRFSRLQGLLGEKIFKEYLILNFRDIEGKSFLEILRMLEKEGLIDNSYRLISIFDRLKDKIEAIRSSN